MFYGMSFLCDKPAVLGDKKKGTIYTYLECRSISIQNRNISI